MFSGSNKNSGGNSAMQAAPQPQPQPQPIPGLAGHHQHSEQQDPSQQTRRSSFAGWPQSLFGFSSASKAPSANGFSPPATYSMAGASSLPDSTASAFSGIGLFRRFSTSGAGAMPPSDGGARRQVPDKPSDYRWPGASGSGLDSALDGGIHGKDKERLQQQHGHPLQPKVFDEIRTHEDPPSRPDSRMRNLMLSGQFLI